LLIRARRGKEKEERPRVTKKKEEKSAFQTYMSARMSGFGRGEKKGKK